MEEIQQWWEVASIAQFCSLFRETLNLPEFDIDELEEGFIADGTPGESSFLKELIIRLLKGCHPRRNINEENWKSHLYRIVDKKWVKEKHLPHPIVEGSAFSELPLRTKVEIIYFLCEFRLDNDEVEHAMKGLDADCLRVQSLGSDDNGNVYWYFYGTRLYKEELSESAKKLRDWTKEWEKEQAKPPEPVKKKRGRPKKRKPVKSDGESEESEECDPQKKGAASDASKSRWSVVCTTLSDWQELAESFEKSKSSCEKSLHRIITKDFLPVLKDMYEQKAKRIKKKMMEFAPRRASSRLEVKKLQQSEENRLASIVAADEFEMYCQNHQESHPELRKERLSRDRSRRLEERRQRLSGKTESVEPPVNKAHEESTSESNYHIHHDAFTLPDATQNRSEEFRNFIIKMRQVLVAVKLHKDAWPFLQPVDESYAPGYYEIISNPVDLSAIENKLNKGLYENINQVDQDFSLMFDNSCLYNGEKSVYSTMALSLKRHFRKSATKYDLISEYHAEVASKIPRLEEEKINIPTEAAEPQNNPEKQNKSHLSENRLRRKRKKRPPGMRAIEALAQASEQALKNATVEPIEPLVSRSQVVYPPKSRAFPDLKIVTIQSHPASLLAKYASSTSQDSVGSDSFPYCSSLSPESSKEYEADRMPQQDCPKSLQCENAEESALDIQSISHSSILSEADIQQDMSNNLNNSHDSTISQCSNSSAGVEDSHVFSQVSVTSETHFSPELNKDTQQDMSSDVQSTSFISHAGNQALAKLSSLLSRISSQGSPNFNIGDSQNVEASEAENASSSAHSSPRHRESFDNDEGNEATPPHISESPESQTVNAGMSPTNFGLLSTVDASVLGLQCNQNLFLRNSTSKNGQRLEDSMASSLSPQANHGSPSLQSTEKTLQDVLLGVEFVSDIAKTMQELDKLKSDGSHSPLFMSSGSPPLMPSGSNFTVANQAPASPKRNEATPKNALSPQSQMMSSDHNALNSLLLPKTLASAGYPVSPDSTETSDKTNPSSSSDNNANMSENSSPSDVENSNKPPEHNLASHITAQFYPLTLPLPVNQSPLDVANQSSHIPLQLPQSFISDINGKHLNPPAVPFFVNSAPVNPLQLTIPAATSSSSSSPITLIPSPHMFTTVPLSINMMTSDSATGVTRTSPLATTPFVGSSSPATKGVPRSGSNDLSNSQVPIKQNGGPVSKGPEETREKNASSVPELPVIVTGYQHHSNDLQQKQQPPLAQNQSVPNLPSHPHSGFANCPSAPFNIPRPPHCVPSMYNAQLNKAHPQDWNLQNFGDSTHLENRQSAESARHSVIMAAHQNANSGPGSALPVFTSAVSSISRTCGQPVVTTVTGKDSSVPFSTLLAQTVPSFVTTAQPAQRNVIVNYVPSDLSNYSVNGQQLSGNNMQYNILPPMQGINYTSLKDTRLDKNVAGLSESTSPYTTTVVNMKSSNSSPTFATSTVPYSMTNVFPASVSTKTSSTNHGSHSTARTASKQSNKKASVHNNAQKHEVATNAHLVPGVQEKVPQVLSNVPGVPTYFSVPQYVLPQQTGVHSILSPHLLTHSNQIYQPNQRFIVGESQVPKINENRQGSFGNRNVQFLTAPSISTTK